MAALIEREKTIANIQKVLDDPDHKKFDKILEFAADRGLGKVPQAVEHSGPDGGPIPVQMWKFGKREVTF